MKHDSASLVTKSKGKRILYFEALRVFACFLVIFNHTVNKALPGGEGAGNYFIGLVAGSRLWWLTSMLYFLCRTAVPIFL